MSKDMCSECHCFKRVASRNPILCFNCYGKKHKEECCICHNIRTINVRNLDGTVICQECNRRKDVCSHCGKTKIIKFSDNGVKLCGNCRSKDRKEACSICQVVRVVAARNEEKPICGECYKELNKDICYICGKNKKIKARKEDGVVCEACWKGLNVGICGICKEEKSLNNTVNEIKVCVSCYHKSRKAVCERCKKYKIICVKGNGGGFLCSYCYGVNRMKIDYKYRIKILLRKSFGSGIKKYLKSGQIGESSKYIDYEKCFEHLGPPPNDGESYHIDHIFPLVAFDFSNDWEIKIAWLPENLRWLKIKDNLIKSGKYNIEHFEKFKNDMRMKYPGL